MKPRFDELDVDYLIEHSTQQIGVFPAASVKQAKLTLMGHLSAFNFGLS